MSRRRDGHRSIDWYLWLLVVCTFVPAFAFSAYLLWNFVSFERRSYEQRLQQSAIDLTNDIERDIEGLSVKLATLATSPSLHRGDLAEFHAQASEASGPGSNIVVLDLGLQQIVNTLVPYGTPLPKAADQQTTLRVIASKSPQVSDLFTGAVARELRLNVMVPVLQQGEVRFVLLLSFRPDRMLQLMRAQNLPPGWVSALSDRQGRVIARSELHERFVGTSLSSDRLAKRSEPAVTAGAGLDGTPVWRIVTPTRIGWHVATTVQQGLIDAAARAAIRNAVIGGSILLLLSLVCAYAISRKLRAPIEALAKQAGALGRGETLAPIHTSIREIDIVMAALSAAEADLRERARQRDDSQAQFQAIMDHTPVFVFVKDLEGRYTFINRAAEQWTSTRTTPAVGMTPQDFLSERAARDVSAADRKVIETRSPVQRELVMEDPKEGPKGGQTRRQTSVSVKFPLFDATGAVSGVGTIVTDITDQKHAETQLAHAQRMDAIGQLTGGIAHDFNNMLTAILLNAEVLAAEVQDERLRQLAEAMRLAAEHGADLTARLLAFGRRQTLVPQPTDVNALLGDMAPLMRRTLGEHIEIKLLRGEKLWPATIDRGQLESAVLNLAVNARDAMPHDAMPHGGRLTIETANAELDEGYAANNPDVRPGHYVMIAVSDTGTGMPPEVLARAFEPFFTTKEVGKGTGLGLSMVYGFVKQSEGHARIYSEVGVGTTVRLYLPRSKEVVPATPAAVPAPEQLPTGTETILLVEDDSLVRGYAAAQLGALGYKVVTAENGRQAIAAIERGCAPDLLFTDMIMPGGMNGRELAEQLLQRQPGLKVLYTSGYAHGAMIGEAGEAAQVTHLLGKPYRRRDLAIKVREVLDEPAAA